MGAFSMLLVCSGGQISLQKRSNSSARRKSNPQRCVLRNAGCSKSTRIRAVARGHAHAEKNSSEGFGPGLARVVGVGLVFAAFTAVSGFKATAAFAAPSVAVEQQQQRQQSVVEKVGKRKGGEVEEEVDDDDALELWMNLMRLCGGDKIIKKCTEDLAAEVRDRGEKITVAELLKEVERSKEGEDGELKRRLTEVARRIQAKLKRSSYLASLRIFFSPDDERNGYIRRTKLRLRGLKSERLGLEYKGWEDVLSYSKQLVQQAVNMETKEQLKSAADTAEEARIAKELSTTGRKLWEENLLPLSMNIREEREEGAGGEIESSVDCMLRNHMQLAGDKERLALSAIKQRMGTAELHAAFGESFPGPETMLGWRKWCSIKQDELKQRLLDDPDFGRQYVEEKQEKLVAARDNVLEQTWYDEKKNRWEMSVKAAVYAVDKNLVHHVRIRHDVRVFYLALKGDNQEYAVDIQELNALLEDEGGFDAFYAKLQLHRIPAVVERMWIPLREWNALQFVKAPVLLLWDFVNSIWYSNFITTGREIYMESLMGVLGEVWIRFGMPVFSKLPHAVRAFLTIELPRGSEFREPTAFMKWQKMAQEKVDERGITLPWWMDIPLRGYVVGAPLLFVGLWVMKLVLFFVGPRPLPKSAHSKALERLKKDYKKMEPLLKQITTNPIKRAFDNMKRIRRPEIQLKDFVGLETFKEEIDEVVSFLRDPRAYKKLGARPPRGVFILGEPGTGKTALARAIAAEARVPVVEFQFYDLEGGGDWVGQRAANVRELFKTARQFAPIILFMDDFHHFVGKRGESGKHDTQEAEALINQFLVELDGFETQEGVVVLATTSYPEKIDEALRRPGRMDRTITLLPPNRAQREQMLRLIARKSLPSYVIDWVNWAEVAGKLEDFTYVELESIPRYLQGGATRSKFLDGQELEAYLHILHMYNTFLPRWIRETPLLMSLDKKLLDWLGLRVTKEDFENAVRYMDVYGRSKPGIELHTPLYKWTYETKYPNAVWAAGRGLVALLLPNFDTVELIWLDEVSWEGIPWTRFRRKAEEGYSETKTKTRSYLEKELVVCYGSFVADRMMLPLIDRTNLSRPQLEEAEQIATSMVVDYGWALDDSPVIYCSEEGAMKVGVQEMDVLSNKVTKLLQLAHDRAAKILSRHKKILEIFVDHLVEHEYLTQEFMEKTLIENNAIFEKEPFMLQTADLSRHQSTNGTGASSALTTA